MLNLFDELGSAFREAGQRHAHLRALLAQGWTVPRGYAAAEADLPSFQRDILFVGLHAMPVISRGADAALNPLDPDSLQDPPVKPSALSGVHDEMPGYIRDMLDAYIGGMREPDGVRMVRDLLWRARLSVGQCGFFNLFAFHAATPELLRDLAKRSSGMELLAVQLQLADRYIREVVRPKLIVPVDSGTLVYLGLHATERSGVRENGWMGYVCSPEPDEVIGCYRLNSRQPEIAGIPGGPWEDMTFILPATMTTWSGRGDKSCYAWMLRRAWRIMSLLGTSKPEDSPHYQMMYDIEVRLGDASGRKKHAGMEH